MILRPKILLVMACYDPVSKNLIPKLSALSEVWKSLGENGRGWIKVGSRSGRGWMKGWKSEVGFAEVGYIAGNLFFNYKSGKNMPFRPKTSKKAIKI